MIGNIYVLEIYFSSKIIRWKWVELEFGGGRLGVGIRRGRGGVGSVGMVVVVFIVC